MYERRTKYQIKELLRTQFNSIREENKIQLNDKSVQFSKVYSEKSSTNEHIMTRKTRTRRPRIHLIQSGYCAVCHIPYNNVEEHIQSKRHQKLIGDDENYISINGFNLHHDTNNIDSYLNLNGIDSIVNESEVDRDYLPNSRSKSMPRARTRAASVCDRVKPSPLSPTGSDTAGHHLRSRKNINYMTPPLEEDSLTDIEPVNQECRELRSSARLLTKFPESEEVWNSGRPKRACLRQKRTTSIDERTNDIMSTKLRSSGGPMREPATSEEDKLFRFKKMRNSELIQLNNEATNFLFPKKETIEGGGVQIAIEENRMNAEHFEQNSTIEQQVQLKDEENEQNVDVKESVCLYDENIENSVPLANNDAEEIKPISDFKVEDEASMDSNCSEGKRKKRRRTHAEAFIMDNEKYYKFEMPGSRLRYQGTFLSQSSTNSPKSPRNNGDSGCMVKRERKVSHTEKAKSTNNQIVFDDFMFSFQRVPTNEAWYQAFERQDKGELLYDPFDDEKLYRFPIPYQMEPLPPLDPRICIARYSQLMKSPTTSADCSTPDPCTSHSSLSIDALDTNDEDSKISAISSTISTTSNVGEEEMKMKKLNRKRIRTVLSGKNPRKSPRQHASTLAILSSLIQQRKRRSGGKTTDKNLPTIPEEETKKNIDEELKELEVLDCDLDQILADLDVNVDESIDFREDSLSFCDIIENRGEELVKSTSPTSVRTVFNGRSQGTNRKPGRRKKKNKTGWPNKNRRMFMKKELINNCKDDDVEDVLINVTNVDTDEEQECENEINETICETDNSCVVVNEEIEEQRGDCADDDQNNTENRVDFNDKVLTNKQTNSGSIEVGVEFQPFVCVEKLESDERTATATVTQVVGKNKRSISPKRTSRRQRRMPGSPKSPRMLRKPRGKWYRER